MYSHHTISAAQVWNIELNKESLNEFPYVLIYMHTFPTIRRLVENIYLDHQKILLKLKPIFALNTSYDKIK